MSRLDERQHPPRDQGGSGDFDLAWRDNSPTVPETPAVSTEALKGLITYIGVTENRQVNITPEAMSTNAVFERARAQLGK